jgi:hypothetical protein
LQIKSQQDNKEDKQYDILYSRNKRKNISIILQIEYQQHIKNLYIQHLKSQAVRPQQ